MAKVSDLTALVTANDDDLALIVEAVGTGVYSSRKMTLADLKTYMGGGTVSGPVSSTDHALARWHGVGGDTLQDSDTILTDAEYLYGLARVGIGPDAGPPSYLLHIQDDTYSVPGGMSALSYLWATVTAGGAIGNFDLGTYSAIEINHNGGTYGHVNGLAGEAYLTDGTIGSGAAGKSFTGLAAWTEVDGGRAYGASSNSGGPQGAWLGIGAYGGEIDDLAGLIIYAEVDGATKNGNAHMIYLVEVAGIDYGIYQNGTGKNRFGGHLGIGIDPTVNGMITLNTPTETLEVIDAGSVAATQQDWIEVEVGGVQGYLHVFAAK